VNRDIAWGLEMAKQVASVRVRHGGYRTAPVHDSKRGEIHHWRGSQDLVLESADSRALSALLGRLQSRLQLQSLSFSVSPEKRRAVEDDLIDEALDAFRARADRVTGKLGAKGFDLVQLQVDASGAPPVPVMRGRVMAMAEAASVAPPALEAGTSTLRAHASGTIELDL
jgi:predicted secreted protein